MSKGIKIKFVNKNGETVTQTCHDPKTCVQHAWLFRLKNIDTDVAETIGEDLEIKAGLSPAVPGIKGLKPVDKSKWSKNIYAPLIEKLVADGGEVFEGPWGSKETDRSVKVQIRDDEFGGMFNLTLADRDDKTLEGSPAEKKHGPVMRYHNVSAWFVGDTVEPYANPEYALGFGSIIGGLGDVPESLSDLRESYTTCPECGRNVGAGNIDHVAFANRACFDCSPKLRAKLETPGWYN